MVFEPQDLFFEWAEHVFVGLFLCEWSLRVIASGRPMMRGGGGLGV